jgi:transcriptional regulator with XRE-family HTH domain
MTLKQIFVQNLKDFRKKEGFSQMKFAEFCDTTTSYIGHIETGRKFPSMDLIEKMAKTLKIEPYHFFINRKKKDTVNDIKTYPKLPESMKNEINKQIDLSVCNIVKEVLNKY